MGASNCPRSAASCGLARVYLAESRDSPGGEDSAETAAIRVSRSAEWSVCMMMAHVSRACVAGVRMTSG